MTAQYGIFKYGKVIFAGDKEVVERAYVCLRETFYFVAGTAKPRTDAFPYTVSQL
jgi:hypothetical protein